MNLFLRLLPVPLMLVGGPLCAQLPEDADSDNTPPVGSTMITSDELHSDQTTHQSVFTGSVKVLGQNFRMTCQEMTVFFTTDNKVDKIVATGDVIITQPDRVTHCGHAVYEQASDTFDLTQQPHILDHQQQYSSVEIIIDRQSQKISMKGRTRVVLPNKSMGGATTTPSVPSPGPLPGQAK